MNTVHKKIERLAEERKFWRLMRGMIFDESMSHIAEGLTARIQARIDEIGEALDSANPEDSSSIASHQSGRRELKMVLKDFDKDTIEKRIFMLDNSIKELQATVQNKTNKGTSGPVPPR